MSSFLRHGSGASEQPPRSDSRLSDYSSALPDLESQLFDEEDGPLLFSHRFDARQNEKERKKEKKNLFREDGAPMQPVHRTQSLLVGGAKAARPQVAKCTVVT